MFWRLIICLGLLIFCVTTDAKNKKETKKTPIKTNSTIIGKQSLVTEIERIVTGIDNRTTIGIFVKSMKDGGILYKQNETKLLIPASIVKILTAEAALIFLGSEYRFPTTVLTDAKNNQIINGVIKGNVYLVHSGDPTLTYEDLNDLMLTLKSLQIYKIEGNVYIDNTAYDQENFGPGWSFEDKRYCYAAPVNASIINRNCLNFKIAPGIKAGHYATIIQNPRYFYGNIVNSIVTKNKGTKSCFIKMNYENVNINLDGCIIKGRDVIGVSTIVEDIMNYNKALLLNLFKRYEIHIEGQVLAGEALQRLSTIAIHYSKPLHVLVNEMLKKSDNMIAGSLLKKIGEFNSKSPGSWKNGGLALKKILASKAHVNTYDMQIIDGSGLSVANRVKPSQMMQILDFAYHHYPTNYEFISALPISGKDGTLKNRLSHVTQKVRAKTGTLAGTGVISLAGYAISKDQEPLAFVIIVNGHNGSVWKYREMEDKIVTALTNYKRGMSY